MSTCLSSTIDVAFRLRKGEQKVPPCLSVAAKLVDVGEEFSAQHQQSSAKFAVKSCQLEEGIRLQNEFGLDLVDWHTASAL